MKRFLLILKTELVSISGSVPFHIIALLSPVMFLFIFAGDLKQDISFPVKLAETIPVKQNMKEEQHTAEPNSAQFESNRKTGIKKHPVPYSGFFKFLLSGYKSPMGTPYFLSGGKLSPAEIIEVKPVIKTDNQLSGSLILKIKDVNANTIKNYRNRLTGGISAYFAENFSGRAIRINEKRVYRRDPSWVSFFASSILVFAVLFCGFIFGSLAFTREWKENGMVMLKLSPVSSFFLLGGKIAGVFLKILTAVVIYLFLSVYAAGEFIFYSAIPSIITGCIFAAPIGMLAGLYFKEHLVSFIFSLVGALTLWVFGGGFGTSISMPDWIRTASGLNPVTGIVNSIRISYFGGSVSLTDYLYPFITGILAFFFLLFIYDTTIHRPARAVKTKKVN
ncbi:MAG: ABC transporter permease [Spirochaetes bacterium]|nr:ABC transporter permease [Spirochaetota bacterium]